MDGGPYNEILYIKLLSYATFIIKLFFAFFRKGPENNFFNKKETETIEVISPTKPAEKQTLTNH